MLQLTNLVQVITECRSCFERAPGSPRPLSMPSHLCTHFRSAPEFYPRPCRPRPETRPVRTPCLARARSCPRPCLFPLAPAVVLVGARQASVDSHLILPTAMLAGSNKKSYCSKVNLEQ
jgi:hypothetical protein